MNQQEVKALVQAALDGMQIPWRGEGEWLRLTTQVRGRTIPVALHLRDERLTLYARLPLQGEEGRMALACNALNRVLGDGCLVADERVDALRAFFAKVNRLISGGRFDAQEEESCFAEYGHDLVLPLDLSDEQAANAIAVAMDLASAYIRFVYEGVRGIAAGDWTVEAAMETVYQ